MIYNLEENLELPVNKDKSKVVCTKCGPFLCFNVINGKIYKITAIQLRLYFGIWSRANGS